MNKKEFNSKFEKVGFPWFSIQEKAERIVEICKCGKDEFPGGDDEEVLVNKFFEVYEEIDECATTNWH